MHVTPPGDGWLYWLEASPAFSLPRHPDDLMELWRPQWGGETQFLRFSDAHPAMNVIGLWWREA